MLGVAIGKSRDDFFAKAIWRRDQFAHMRNSSTSSNNIEDLNIDMVKAVSLNA
jgi:hypothetical protein